MTTLAVIPARGGSTQLRRKNLLPDADGVPLVLVSARAARDAGCTVVVSTDDPEVESLATLDGFRVHRRGAELSDVPVDEVVAVAAAGHTGGVLLVQPTVQPITPALLNWFLSHRQPPISSVNPTTWQPSPMALGVPDRHLIWHDGQVLTERLERQSETEWPIREMGVRWWPRLPLTSPGRVIAAPHPLTDVDDAGDYQRLGRRLRIQFTIVANQKVGSGHLRRALTLAEGLQQHDVAIRSIGDISGNVYDILDGRGWRNDFGGSLPDVEVHDCLDLRYGTPVPSVNLETTLTDGTVTINAMYGHGDYTGADYAVLRPEFTIGDYRVNEAVSMNVDAGRVMVMFGGTDPSHLTRLALTALRGFGHVTYVKPGTSVSVAALMHDHDLLITSGGRTVFEAAAVGIPTIVMCQNLRETSHTHLGVGNLNLGLGTLVETEHLTRIVDRVLAGYDLRLDMSHTAKTSIDGLGAARIRRIIEHVATFGEKP